MMTTLILCFIINRLFLESYYQDKKIEILENSYDIMEEALSSEKLMLETFSVEIKKISETHNIDVLILDTESKIMISTANDNKYLTEKLFESVFIEDGKSKNIVKNDNYTISTINDAKTRTDYMQMWGILSDGNLFFMRTPLDSVRESVDISNKFLAKIGFFAIIIGGIVVYIISSRLTKPIAQLSQISKSMINLEFEKKYVGKSKNEIGILGENMNNLSEKLETTISEIKNINRELKLELNKKEEIEKTRRDFVSNVSHEFKTPIALIQGYAEGLVDDIDMDYENKKYYCEVILDETVKMNDIVQKLLTLNQLETRNETMTLERFDIIELINNYLQTMEIIFKQKNIDVLFKGDESIYVWGDAYQVEEVIRNYISNAVNHCKNKKQIKIRVDKGDLRAKICIFNTGDIIPDTSIDKIWDKFYKVDKSRSREYGGSGIGLSIVKAILTSLNQEYGVKNYEDGVEFWFELEI